MEELIAQYTHADEDLRLVRQNITRMEFDTTLHVLQKYLKHDTVITELGAATGRYSLHYASKKHRVTAVELAPDQVDILTRKASEQQIPIDIFQGNAVSVPFIEDETQDAVLILGPLYHLREEESRQSVLKEAMRILKPGGIVAVAYISRFFVTGMFAQHFPELVTRKVLEQLVQTGTVDDSRADRFFRVGYFGTPTEIEALVTSTGFSLREHVATDGYGRYIAAGLNALSEEQYQVWLKLHLSTCNERTLLGSSNHGLIIAEKNNC